MQLPGNVVMPALRALMASPASLQRLAAGPPLRLDGQELDLQVQLMLKLLATSPSPPLESLPVDAARSQVVRETRRLAGRPPEVAGVDQLQIPREGDAPIRARLYVPRVSSRPLPLLIYFHGGGFVVCDLETHDNTCRFVAREADMLVLAVDYRRAPEHPFPAAVEDAMAAFAFAAEHAHALRVTPSAIAVGGDSSGGNLAAVICQQSRLAGIEPPAFQWLLYPMTDSVEKRPSYELFGKGFLLTAGQMAWFESNYLASPGAALDPRASPLRATSLGGLPPAYVATAGFDVLRDEGEEYAQRLRAAGTPVTQRRYSGLVHGFAAQLGVGNFATRALGEAVGALRAAVSAQRN